MVAAQALNDAGNRRLSRIAFMYWPPRATAKMATSLACNKSSIPSSEFHLLLSKSNCVARTFAQTMPLATASGLNRARGATLGVNIRNRPARFAKPVANVRRPLDGPRLVHGGEASKRGRSFILCARLLLVF